MTRFHLVRALCIAAVLLLSNLNLAAQTDPDRVQFNSDIRIQPEESVGDVTCVHCSVYVSGHVSGDVAVIAGSVFVQQGGSVAGDVTAVGGDAGVKNGATVAGDLTAIGGNLRNDPQATVSGNVATIGGGRWVFLIFLLPLFFLGGIVALIIWLIQRSRHPAAPLPAYPRN